MIIKETTPFGRIFHRWLYVLTFALMAGLVASGSAFADHSRGHKGDTGGGSGGNDNNLPVIEDQFFSLVENEPSGSLVGQVVATSSKKNITPEYEIIAGNGVGSFVIDLFSGVLSTATPLDHEEIPEHALTVQATDKFGSSTGIVTVSVGDVNEAPVVNDASFAVPEQSALSTIVGTVPASDPDDSSESFGTLAYAIIGGNDGLEFSIDALSGQISAQVELDHETVSLYDLTVEVTDGGNLSDVASVTVSIEDVNEAPVVNVESFAISELTPVGTVVKTVQASDPDNNSEPFGTLTYQIAPPISGPYLFEIDPSTGELTTIVDLDHETDPSVLVTVQVSDGGGLSTFADFTVMIEDANEAPTAADTSFDVSEKLPEGSIVGTVPASDPDNSAPNNTLSYAITSGNVGPAFDIDSATGELSTLTALKFDVTPTYNLTVEVTDGGGLSDTANVTVNVNEAVIPSNVSEIDGTNGFALTGDSAGSPVAILGDVNGDGIDDYAVSAPGADVGGLFSAGSVYVVFGNTDASAPELDLTLLGETEGFRFDGTGENEFTGEFINSAGDINNDGMPDILIGAPRAFNETNNTFGAVYVVFGAQQFAPVMTPADLDGAKGFRVISEVGESGLGSGFALTSIGDINGDGVDDFGAGLVNSTVGGTSPPTGKVYAIFGRDIPNSEPDFESVFDLTNLDASTGMVLHGAPGDAVGIVMSPTGDLNGDGFGDFIINALDTGRAYIVFGNLDLGSPVPGGPAVEFDLTTLDGTNGFIINGVPGEFLGGGNGGGDINGDGHSDAVISAPGEDGLNGELDVGAVYVIFGGPGIDWGSFDLTLLNGANGFKILGAADSDDLGYPLDNRSDINGDGFDDIVAGTNVVGIPTFPPPGEDPPPPPPTVYYLIAGSNQPYPALIDLKTLDPSMGNMIQAPARTESMGAGGDVNGDGVDDFILSSGRDDLGNDTPAYVVFGGDF